jgi:hypothetical protein
VARNTIRTPGSTIRLELFESDRLVVSGRDGVEETLPSDTAERLFHLETVALGDFSSRGCESWRNGDMNADWRQRRGHEQRFSGFVHDSFRTSLLR